MRKLVALATLAALLTSCNYHEEVTEALVVKTEYVKPYSEQIMRSSMAFVEGELKVIYIPAIIKHKTERLVTYRTPYGDVVGDEPDSLFGEIREGQWRHIYVWVNDEGEMK